MTPKIPVAARINAIAANKLSKNVRNRGCATEASRASDMEAILDMGKSLSILATSCRVVAATLETLRGLLATTTAPHKGACAKGTYIIGLGSLPRDTSRTSPTTPTIRRGTPG